MFEIKVFTLYPDLYPGPLNTGIYKKAQEKKIWGLKVINMRDYANDKHSSVDDTPFGGGNGMLLRPDVVAAALDDNLGKSENIILRQFQNHGKLKIADVKSFCCLEKNNLLV